MNDLLTIMPSDSIIFYADDTAIFTSSWGIALLSRRLQIRVDGILQFLSKWKMSINPNKTEVIIFTRKTNKLPPPVRVLNYSLPGNCR